MQDLTIVIPAYNEADSLASYLPKLIDFCEKEKCFLIVVNDGSKDQTQDVLRSYASMPNFHFVSHKVNRGYGGAIKTGIRNTETTYVITIDADGQHELSDVKSLYQCLKEHNADMVVGSRKGQREASFYRGIGKNMIRWFAKMLLPIHIYDINSGMKIYNTDVAIKYLGLCPDHMAYSDIIAMVFISQKHLVLEKEISINPRLAGVSTINTMTALDTVREILNIVVLFNPMRVFLPISLTSIVLALAWGIPIILRGRGVSTGAMLGFTTGIIFFFLGLLAEQMSQIRKNSINK